jgi:toxin ParE1/3/4
MKRFVLTRPAERDLDQIKSYLVEKAGPTIARRVMKEIRSALYFLGSQPEVGNVREDLGHTVITCSANTLQFGR